MSLHTMEVEGRDIRDPPLESEQALQKALIGMIPTPGGHNAEGGAIIRQLLSEFLGGFSIRTLIFPLDMVLPQLDAYHTGRQMQHLLPWVSVALVQAQVHGHEGLHLTAMYQYEAYAGFHVINLVTEGAPLLLFGDPNALPQQTPWQLCEPAKLGSMESNVMAGRALGCLHLPSERKRCAIFIVHNKVMQGTNRTAAHRAYRRIAPRSIELVLLPHNVARAFCGRLIEQQVQATAYSPNCCECQSPNCPGATGLLG